MLNMTKERKLIRVSRRGARPMQSRTVMKSR
jgi:hypothetical protein